jgi:hypothetical protein
MTTEATETTTEATETTTERTDSTPKPPKEHKKLGRKQKFDTDEERRTAAKEQRDNWRKLNNACEKEVKNKESPFQKQLVVYLKRNVIEPEVEAILTEMFKEKFMVVIAGRTVLPTFKDTQKIVIVDNETKKVKTRLLKPTKETKEAKETKEDEKEKPKRAPRTPKVKKE